MAPKKDSNRNRPPLHLEALEKRELLSAWDGLRVSEIMFTQDYEFIELHNAGTEAIPLNGVKISEGTSYTFGPGDTLPPGQFLVVAANRAAFLERYGQEGIALASGALTGGLDSTDERIKIERPDPVTAGSFIEVIDFTYNPALTDDQGNAIDRQGNIVTKGNEVFDVWYPILDNGHFSLTLNDPAGMNIDNHDQRDAWRPSSERGGTPGRADHLTRSIVINEILAHSDEVNGDWIELYNKSDAAIDVSNWYLSDDLYELKKYRIATDTIIPAHGYLVLNQIQHFGDSSNDPGAKIGFGFSEFGDIVILSSADAGGTLSGTFEERGFGASQRNISFGRYEKSTETTNFVAMSVNTPGAVNAGPKTGPIVISEIMYHPVQWDTIQNKYIDFPNAEYIELFNISDSTVTFDVQDVDHKEIWTQWQFTSGIEFKFPEHTTLAPGQRLIIAQNIATFNSTYGNLPDKPQILGPFSNQTALSDKGEKLELSIPNDQVLDGIRTYIRMDRVGYNDKAPWPTTPDGTGPALVRFESTGYGNDPANWTAAAPLNAPPAIGQLTVATVAGGPVTLSVNQAQDLNGSVASVRFYRDANRNGQFDTQDTLLGSDSNSADGWQWQTPSEGLFNGVNTFFAVARDNGNKDSAIVTAQGTVKAPNKAPAVQALYATPGQVVQGETIALTASNVTDSDGTAVRCDFYLDSNQNGILDGNDPLLGQDRKASNGWTWTGTTGDFPVGAATVFVRASDNEGAVSNPVSATLTITPPNQLPVVGALSAGVASVILPDSFTLTATSVSDSDGTVTQVAFFADANGNNQLDASDTLLGADTSSANGWSWTVDTTALSAGARAFFARALDNSGASGAAASTSVTLLANQAPVIGGLQANPNAAVKPDTFTLTAAGVADTDGTVTQVAFYHDSNRNNQLDAADTLLGTDTTSANGWSWPVSTAALSAGAQTFWARALDERGALSAPASASVTILANQPPVVAGLSVTPAAINPGQTVSLTAAGVTDPENHPVTSVSFYLDGNNNNQIDATDTLLGQGTAGAQGWTLASVTLPALPAGTVQFLALAGDDHGGVSAPASATLRLNAAPQAGTLTVTPGQIIQGDDITLTLNGAIDNDGTIKQAEFWFDANHNGAIDSEDILLGADPNPADGLALTLSSESLPADDLKFLARVTDNDNRVSATVAAQIHVGLFQVTLLPDSARTVIYTDPDGTLVQVSLSKGSATLRFSGAGLSDNSNLNGKTIVVGGGATLAEIELLDALCQTGTLTFKTKGGDNRAELGSLTGTGLKSLSATTVNLAGAIDLTGSIDAIALNGLANQAVIRTGTASKGLTLTAATIGNGVEIAVNDTLKKLQTGTLAGGTVTARSLIAVAVTAGGLGADLIATDGPIGAVAIYGDIASRIESAASIKSVVSKTGGLTAGAAIVADADIAAVTMYGDIAGQVSANGTIKAIASKTGALNHATLRAGLDLVKLSTLDIQSGLISAGRHLGMVLSKTNIVDSLLLCGYDIGADGLGGTADDRFNQTEAVLLKSIKTGSTGHFDGTVALAGVAPAGWDSPAAALAADPVDQQLNRIGGTIKSAFVGQVWQGEHTTPYGLFASTAMGKVSFSKTAPSGSDAPGQFLHVVLSQPI